MPVYVDISSEGVGKKFDEDAVEQGLINLLNTKLRERVFNPEFGCDFEDNLFELVTDEGADAIEAELWSCLSQEQRIRILDIIVKPDVEKMGYYVEIIYQIKELDISSRILSGVMKKKF